MSRQRNQVTPEHVSRFQIKLQWGRGFIVTSGVLVAVVARMLDQLEVSWLGIVAFLLIGIASAVGFATLAARHLSRLAGLPLHWLWLALDVGLFTWVVMATGGSQSFWFPWALANVAAAGFALGERGAFVIMLADAAAYLVAVLILEGSSSGPLTAVLVRLLVLYTAGFFAVRGICRLRARDLRIVQLREQESRRSAELRQLQESLDERDARLERLSEELRKVAVTDPQTGTYNRRYLQQRIAEDMAMVRRAHAGRQPAGPGGPGRDLGFLLLDLDSFKRVNDEHGQEAGDEVLRQVSAVLSRVVRGMDTVIRWSSDSFLVLLRQVDRDDLAEVTGRVARAVRHESFSLPDEQHLSLSCSCGFTYYPLGDPDRFSWSELIKIADGALQLAREAGPDRAIGVTTGSRPFDAVGARLATSELREAEQRGYVRLIEGK